MAVFISPKTFAAGEQLTFTEINALIGSGGDLEFLKNALAAIGITADSGNQTVDAPITGCRVSSTGNLQLRDSTWTRIPWASQRFGRLNGADFNYLVREYPAFIHFPASVWPTLSGSYLIGAHVEFAGNATGQRGVRLINQAYPTDLDRADVVSARLTDSIGAGSAMALSIATMVGFIGGSSIACEVYQSSTADLTLNSANAYSAEMWAVRIGLYPV